MRSLSPDSYSEVGIAPVFLNEFACAICEDTGAFSVTNRITSPKLKLDERFWPVISNRMRDRYSVRNAVNGSTFAARRAGHALAASATQATPATASM